MKFRLGTIAYVFALLAAGMAAFGGAGIFVAALIGGSWLWAFRSGPSMPLARAWRGGIRALALLLMIGLFVSAVSAARDVAVRSNCRGRLAQLAFALQQYEVIHGTLPSATTRGVDGASLHSWRTLIAPLFDQQALLPRIDLKASWNSPANATITAMHLEFMQCPACESLTSETSYFAVVGDSTAWPADRGRAMSEIRDAPQTTILLLESWKKRAAWGEPGDLSFDEAVKLLSDVPVDPASGHEVDDGYFYKSGTVVCAALVDGSVAQLRLPLSRELAVGLLTVDGGEKIDVSELDRAAKPELDFATVYAFIAFVALTLLPLRWAFAGREARGCAHEKPPV